MYWFKRGINMKILSIGNSFSQDAHKWLHDIAVTDGYDLETTNLFIPSCSLEMHCNNLLSNAPDYDFEGNGGVLIKKASIKEAIENDVFDIVTVQQVSGLSGIKESYMPYITQLVDYVREKQPKAKIYFHRTWSYEIDSKWPGFVNYNNNQKEMFEKIRLVSEEITKLIGAEIIPVGDAIQSLRETTKEFNYLDGGISLCRDGGHMSFDYGRFAASAVWYKVFTGRKVNIKKFSELNKEFDINLLNVIINNIL